MSSWAQDLRYAIRNARRAKGFFSLAVLTLAIGIGGTTTMFSFVRGILLLPLPYDEPATLVVMTRNNRELGFSGLMMPARDVATILERNRSFSAVVGYTFHSVHLSGGDVPERVRAGRTLPGLLEILGVELEAGRVFDLTEYVRGSSSSATRSHNAASAEAIERSG